MNRTTLVGVFAGLGLLLSWADPLSAQRATSPTYNGEVAPIISRHCAECHRANQIAPMSLLSYQEVRPWAAAIKAKVRAREMPPWFADPRFGKFANDKSLPQSEIETIERWVDAGAPQGTGSAPALPEFSDAG